MEQALKMYFIHPQEFSSFIETYIYGETRFSLPYPETRLGENRNGFQKMLSMNYMQLGQQQMNPDTALTGPEREKGPRQW